MGPVFIATPAYDEWACVEYCTSLAETAIRLTDAGISMYHGFNVGNPFLDLSRNQLVDKFLSTDAESILFIDADVGWDPKTVARVLSHPQEIVGGLVPKRDKTRESCFHQNAITGVMSAEGLFQAIELPTAFMRIRRSAFAKLAQPYFRTGSSKEDFGEDIYFCRRWSALGEFLWIDSDITFSHRGGKAWRGNFYEHCVNNGLLKLAEAA